MDPYVILTHYGLLFFVGWVHEYREVRTFAVERMKALEPTGREFQVRPDFSIEKLMADSFGVMHGEEPITVKVRFDKEVADEVKYTTFHQSQKTEDLPNGDILFEMRASDREEIKNWIFSYHHWAEVLEPKALRDEILRELKQCLAAYQKKR